MDTISVPLENNVNASYRLCQSKVCGDRWARNVKYLNVSAAGNTTSQYESESNISKTVEDYVVKWVCFLELFVLLSIIRCINKCFWQ